MTYIFFILSIAYPKNPSRSEDLCDISYQAYFLRWGIVIPTSTPPVGGPPRAGCPLLFVPYILILHHSWWPSPPSVIRWRATPWWQGNWSGLFVHNLFFDELLGTTRVRQTDFAPVYMYQQCPCLSQTTLRNRVDLSLSTVKAFLGFDFWMLVT
jgi:hypothetical protein